eukprot:c4174_g1_i2.p1 GENE.c4174_g1_i2~~c4174_g1_i2.p1  ORF type:complete len:716 (-),score=206.21 c4174_g1_i2:206-2065(-)
MVNETVSKRIDAFGDLVVALNGSKVRMGEVMDKLWRTDSLEEKSRILEEAASTLKNELNVTRTNLSVVSLSHAGLAKEKQLAADYMTGTVNYETGKVVSKDGAVLEDADSDVLRLLKPTDPAMFHENIQLIVDVNWLVVFGLIGALGAARYRLPVLIGFVAAGMVIGPSALNLVEELTEVETLSQMGVIFLLFELGVDFSFSDLKRVGTTALGGGALQMGFSIVAFGAVCVWAGVVERWKEGVFLGACVSLSSTAVVANLLSGRKQNKTEHGKVMLALLIAQDLAIGLILSLLPAFKDSPDPTSVSVLSSSTSSLNVTDIAEEVLFHRKTSRMHLDSPFLFILLLTSVKLMGLAFIAFFWTMFIMPRIYKVLRANGIHEIYLFGMLGYCLGVSLLTDVLGLGLELGAFLAGLTVIEREEVSQTKHTMISLRTLFGGMFFVSIGLIMSPRFVFNNFTTIFGFAVAIMLIKCIICAFVVRLFRYGWRTGLLVGAGISQIGEFSFLVASKGQALGFMSRPLYLKLISATVLTLILTPFFMSFMEWVTYDPRGSYRSLGSDVSPGFNNNSGSNDDDEDILDGSGAGGVVGGVAGLTSSASHSSLFDTMESHRHLHHNHHHFKE